MFAFLILLSLILLSVLFFLKGVPCWRHAFLSALIAFGVILSLITEALNIFSFINTTWILIAWGVVDGAIALFLFLHYKPTHISDMARRFIPDIAKSIQSIWRDPFLAFFSLSLGIILILTGIIAFTSPPNTPDSQIYHMSRVMHWLQNQSVNHYSTHVTRQIDLQPWSGFAILHLQALSGGDRVANFVQWTSMIGCLVGVSLIARELRANLIGQLLSSLICLSIPIGLLQAVTTQTDYVVSLWLTCLAYYFLLLLKGQNTIKNHVGFGSSLGLALLTKGTAYIYAFPFCVIWFLSLIRSSDTRLWRIFKPALIGLLPAIALNFNHWWRNLQVFHDPLGVSGEGTQNKLFTLEAIISNLLRNISLHLAIPFQPFNVFFANLVIAIHENLLGLDVNDPRTTFRSRLPFDIPVVKMEDAPIFLGEEISGNFLHLLLIFISISLYLGFRRSRNYERTLYLLVTLSTAFLFCMLLTWQPFGARLQLPFFVLMAPFIGTVIHSVWSRFLVSYFLVFTLTLSAIPYCLFSSIRPLAQNSYFYLYPSTIFEIPRFEQYFITAPRMRETYTSAMNTILDQGCYDIGLYTDVGPREYPFWVLAQASSPGKHVRFRSVNVENLSKDIKNSPEEHFLPCAILFSFLLVEPDDQQDFLLRDMPSNNPIPYILTFKEGRIAVYLSDRFSKSLLLFN